MPRALHDAPYKLLFSSPRMVADLIRGFVPDPWLARFDPATLVPAPTNLVTPRMQQLHSDMVWRLHAPDAQGEVIVHIEFQSRPRHDMPLRMLEYLAHILKGWVRNAERPQTDGWPPVLSIVLYSGKARWHGSPRIEDHIRRLPRGLLRRSVQHRFVLIDIQRLRLQQLDRLDSVLALLMRFELRHRSEDMMEVMARLDHQIARQDPLRETIRTWALAAVGESSSLAPLLDEFVNVKGTAMSFKENVEAYFAKRDRLARDQGMRAGWAEGKREGQRLGQRLGQREGRIKGQAEILSRQIARRFGPLDEATQNRLASAKPAMLQRWADAILTANTLEEVFATKH